MRNVVLLVDDDSAHRLMSARALRRALPQLEVREAASRAEAEHSIQELASALRIAIVDLKLDHESGIDVVTTLRARHSADEVPAIVVSTSDLAQHVYASYAAGANTYVVKGVTPAAFTANLLAAVEFLCRPCLA